MKNVAVIGGGQIFETVHLKAINQIDTIDEVHVVEPNETRRIELAVTHPYLILHDKMESLLENHHIDDAIVCVPNKFHAEITVQLLKTGINVLCEKPPAITSSEAYAMWQTAEKATRKLFYNFHLRQIESLSKFKAEVESCYSVDVKALRRRGIPGWGNFIDKNMQGGGALIDLGIHYLDLVLSLLDSYEFKSLHAITDNYIGKHESEGDFGSWDSEKFTVENFCNASLKSNFMLTLNTSFAHNIAEKDIYEVTIFTHEGRIELLRQKQFDTENNLIFESDKEIDQQALRIKSSLEFLSGSYSNMCDGEHGYLIQKLVEKIYESAENK